MVEGFVVLFLQLNQIMVLGKVSTRHNEFEQLSREVLSIIVLLRHLDNEVFTSEVNLRLDAVFSVAKLVDFHPGVLVGLDTSNLAVGDSKRDSQEE